MATAMDLAFSTALVSVDRYELERTIREAFLAAVGEDGLSEVHVSRFPHEYGAVVLLRGEPSPELERVALEQEERFRAAGIEVGILVEKARDTSGTRVLSLSTP